MMQKQSPKRARESELKQLEPRTSSSAAAAAAPSSTLLPPSTPVSSLLPPLPPQQGAQQNTSAALANHQPAVMQALQQLFQPQAAANAVLALNNQNNNPFGSDMNVPGAMTGESAIAQANNLSLTTPTAQLVTTQHPHQPIVAPQQSSNASAVLSTPVSMQNWTLEQLEAHVSLLQHLKQPIPQTLEFLLADARRRREKKIAKRVANRKSASTSRARKKAQIKELMELNARLRRQALILALLPDLVIVVDVNGVITFCSAQVERVLRHKPNDLVGSKLTDLLVPSSRQKLLNLIKELVEKDLATTAIAEADETVYENQQEQKGQERQLSEQQLEVASANESNTSDTGRLDEIGIDPSSAESSAAAAVISDLSFPMSVVKVDAAAAKPTAEENSDSSTSRLSKQPSSLTNSSLLTRSLTASSLGNSASEVDSKNKKRSNVDSNGERKASAEGKLPSSDTSNISSLSTEAKKLQTANNNLERNVRWHNRKMKDMRSLDGVNFFMDDVTGAAVTANNATARLSSLRVRHRESSSEDDSGYRESNDSRTEETSSSSGDSSELNGQRKPLTPTCNICLIRDDLTTVWCEMTSSIRTRDVEEEEGDANLSDAKPKAKASSGNKLYDGSEGESQPPRKQEVRELLLCLRPIRDGKEKAEAKYRFVPLAEKRQVSEGSEITTVIRDEGPWGPSGSSSDAGQAPPKKKRKKPSSDSEPSSSESPKRSKGASDVVDSDVAVSLMLISNDKN